MRRREFITSLGGTAAWPMAASAQQQGGDAGGGEVGNSAASSYASRIDGLRSGCGTRSGSASSASFNRPGGNMIGLSLISGGPRSQTSPAKTRLPPRLAAGKDYRSQGLIQNGYYPTPDAELYAAYIADFRPTRIIEIGSGYSTLIANHALRHQNHDCEIRVVDPEPRRDVAGYASHIEFEMVQNSSLANGKLLADAQRTILFIDSSHVTKLGGDIPFLYCQLLPMLPPGVLVHVHDIFTPFDYPTNYGWRFYTEQYVLQALLAHNPKMSVRFSTHAMSRLHPAAMQKAFGPQVGIDPRFFGASFWMQSN